MAFSLTLSSMYMTVIAGQPDIGEDAMTEEGAQDVTTENVAIEIHCSRSDHETCCQYPEEQFLRKDDRDLKQKRQGN